MELVTVLSHKTSKKAQTIQFFLPLGVVGLDVLDDIVLDHAHQAAEGAGELETEEENS